METKIGRLLSWPGRSIFEGDTATASVRTEVHEDRPDRNTKRITDAARRLLSFGQSPNHTQSGDWFRGSGCWVQHLDADHRHALNVIPAEDRRSESRDRARLCTGSRERSRIA